MTAGAVELLRHARELWPSIIDEEFVQRLIKDGLLQEEDADKIFSAENENDE